MPSPASTAQPSPASLWPQGQHGLLSLGTSHFTFTVTSVHHPAFSAVKNFAFLRPWTLVTHYYCFCDMSDLGPDDTAVVQRTSAVK